MVIGLWLDMLRGLFTLVADELGWNTDWIW